MAPQPNRPPGYWLNETSGALKPAVIAYLENQPMTGMHIAAMRAYLRQWINSDVWDANPHGVGSRLAELRRLVESLHTREDIKAWIEIATAEGLDPL